MGRVIAIIPARSGSKSIKDKNIRIMNGKPMMAYSIEHALASKKIDRILVSTDSPAYKEIAESFGAEVPFLRPAAIAQDSSLDIEVFQHTLQWLKENENYEPDICVHLRPTHPIRNSKDIDAMIELLESNQEIDSVRSVSPVKQTPYKMWLFNTDSIQISPIVTCSIPEAYNAPRQILPQAYMQNACIDVVRTKTILEQNSMSGRHIAGYRMNYDFDIDTENDFLAAERALLLSTAKAEGRRLKICCDIDGILAAKTPRNNYDEAIAIPHNLSILNALYERGHYIVLFTARGYSSGIDWKDTTKKQMQSWGVKYHELLFSKPDADVYIDDKFMELETLYALI